MIWLIKRTENLTGRVRWAKVQGKTHGGGVTIDKRIAISFDDKVTAKDFYMRWYSHDAGSGGRYNFEIVGVPYPKIDEMVNL